MLISHGPVRHTYKPEAGCDRPCALSGVPGDCVARLCVPESRPVAAWFKWLARNSDPLHLRRRGIHPHVASNDFALSSGANLFQLLCQQRDFWPSPRPVWRHRTSSRPVSACRDVDLCRADGHLDIAVFGTTDSRGRGPSRLNPPLVVCCEIVLDEACGGNEETARKESRAVLVEVGKVRSRHRFQERKNSLATSAQS